MNSSTRYLLDTNICIYLIQHHPPGVATRFQRVGRHQVAMSVVSYAELARGAERCEGAAHQQAWDALKRLTAVVPVEPFDDLAAEQFGRLAAKVRDRRRDALDRMIAAHAIRLDAVLVTNNEADFTGFPPLRVENWTRDDA